MKKVIHKAASRGFADHGWLQAQHSFSFANWFDQERINFGALRVLNDDYVVPGKGFGMHPHENMEIVTIPLSGSLAHKDNKGHENLIRRNDIQVMSAGKGIWHSESNASDLEPVTLFQVWILPEKDGCEPRYDQKYFDPEGRLNTWQKIIAPEKGREWLWLNQKAYFSLANLECGHTLEYRLHGKNQGLYIFIINGEAGVEGEILAKRDAIGLWDVTRVSLTTPGFADILAIEVPMLQAG